MPTGIVREEAAPVFLSPIFSSKAYGAEQSTPTYAEARFDPLDQAVLRFVRWAPLSPTSPTEGWNQDNNEYVSIDLASRTIRLAERIVFGSDELEYVASWRASDEIFEGLDDAGPEDDVRRAWDLLGGAVRSILSILPLMTPDVREADEAAFRSMIDTVGLANEGDLPMDRTAHLS